MLAAIKDKPHLPFLVGNVLLGFILLILVLMFFMAGSAEREMAMQSGQRLLVNLKTGEMEGEMHQLFPDELPEESMTPADGAMTEEGAPETTEAPATTQEPINAPAPVTDTSDPYAEFTAGLEETMAAAEKAPSDASVADIKPMTDEKKDEKHVPLFPRTVASLEPANQVFMQQTPHGMLPDRAPNDALPWMFYARKNELPEDVVKIAVAITDLGAHHRYGSAALALPLDTTLMFTNYSPDAPTWLESARNRGQEAWLQLPIEMNNYPAADPGPLGLITNLSQLEVKETLHKNLARLQAYTGVYFPPNDKFTRAGTLMQVVLNDLRARGILALVGDRDATRDFKQRYNDTVMPQALHIAPPYNKELLERTFSSVERKALEDKRMIVTISPTPLALDTLKTWLPSLAEKGIALVPLSALADES